jgi:phosphoglycerate dehydrogenase-like enzyme
MLVGCDLFLNLKLYRIPEWLLQSIKESFPNIEIVSVNSGSSQPRLRELEVYWGNRITSALIDSMPALRWIHFGSVGVERASTRSVHERKVIVTNSKGTMEAAMVASALAFMTALARGLHHSQRLCAQGTMDREHFDRFFEEIQDLDGQRCLIVGFGNVGRRFAKVCAALGMEVSAIRRENSRDQQSDLVAKFTLSELVNAVRSADYIVNLLPLTNQTKNVFDEAVFHAMKPSAFFVNLGRGQTVDETALVDALTIRRIAGAGIDVFANEPLRSDSPLCSLPNVILTPHVAGLSQTYWKRQGELFKHNLGCFVSGEFHRMYNVCNISTQES